MNRLFIVLQAILLYIVVDAASSVKEVHSMYACCGDSVRLFQNISTKEFGTETFLYKSTALIAVWSVSNNPVYVQKDERFTHDNNGNIWLHSIDVSDNTKYDVAQAIDNIHSDFLYEVRLIVLVPPEKSCRPQLNREGDTLIASLETDAACGNLEATVYWLDHPYLAHESQAKVKLSPGREAGTYYACIETPALRCAGRFNPGDFCSSITIDKSNYHTTTEILILLITVLCSVQLLVAILSKFMRLVQYCTKKRNPSPINQKQEGMPDRYSANYTSKSSLGSV